MSLVCKLQNGPESLYFLLFYLKLLKIPCSQMISSHQVTCKCGHFWQLFFWHPPVLFSCILEDANLFFIYHKCADLCNTRGVINLPAKLPSKKVYCNCLVNICRCSNYWSGAECCSNFF